MTMFILTTRATQVRWQHEEDVDDCNSCKVKNPITNSFQTNFQQPLFANGLGCLFTIIVSLSFPPRPHSRSPNAAIIVGIVVGCSVPSVLVNRCYLRAIAMKKKHCSAFKLDLLSNFFSSNELSSGCLGTSREKQSGLRGGFVWNIWILLIAVCLVGWW